MNRMYTGANLKIIIFKAESSWYGKIKEKEGIWPQL